MSDITKRARELCQVFIHQPQTGRCLAFLLVLGTLVRKICSSYEETKENLFSMQNLDVSLPSDSERAGRWQLTG
jgi:hypothetical protein